MKRSSKRGFKRPSKMTTKFNKEMYAKIKMKKNEPLFAIGQRKLKITDKEKEKEMVERVSSTLAPDLDEGDKGKEKVGFSVWEDAGVAMDRASELLTPGEMKEISSIPSHEMVLGETMHITTQYLANEEKAVMANSKVEALEAEASGLRKDLIAAMNSNNKDELLALAGQRMKAAIAKAVLAFQSTDEYNTILFQWYFKGFELLKRYLIKHGLGTDLEELDFKAVDKEMEEDEAALAA
uniref:Uncharacterized protein n=1 Tax=Quercus lobata TaxID=97700 RepID=A0A7N2M5S4_QUELO